MASVALVPQGDGVVSVGRVFSRAFGFIVRNPAISVGSAFLFGALPSIASQALTFGIMGSATGLSRTMSIGLTTLQLLSFVVALVFGALVQAIITRGVVIEHEGGRPSLGECLSGALRYSVPIVLLTILWWLGLMIGFVFLLVPGLMLLTMWAVAVPALIEERTGVIGAFGRSRALTKGSRWKIFGLLMVLLIGIYLIMGIVGVLGLSQGALTPTAGSLPVTLLAGSAIMGFVFNLIWSTIQPSLFVELRDAHEGGSVSDLHQVFA